MAPKRKDFLKPNAKGKAKARNPESENEFLEAADEFEQAGGKWRAGDAAKALRFFNRAIDVYNTGLQRYPTSFDLAYNKANLEYNMTDDSRIVTLLGSKINLLEETLNSHRVATSLNPENTDVLFNTGQVLTSLAEALLESGTQESMKEPARTMLEEAASIFTKCLANQQKEYEETQAAFANAQTAQEPDERFNTEQTMTEGDMETSSTTSEAPGEWATVIEPVTPETILETCTAQLGALTTLLSLYDPADLTSIQPMVQNGVETANTKIPTLINLLQSPVNIATAPEPTAGPTLSIYSTSIVEEPKTTPKEDAVLATAIFQSSIAEISYRSGQSSLDQYAAQIAASFRPLIESPPSIDSFQPGFVNVLSAQADVLMELASAVADNPLYNPSSPNIVPQLEAQWDALTQAQTILTRLSTATNASNLAPSRLADIFLARGDTDLFRFRISLSESAKPAWSKSKTVLVSNAGVFYRGARSYAEKASVVDVLKTADAKAIVAEILKEAANGSQDRKAHWKGRSGDVVKVLEQMVEEGIVRREDAEGVVPYTE